VVPPRPRGVMRGGRGRARAGEVVRARRHHRARGGRRGVEAGERGARFGCAATVEERSRGRARDTASGVRPDARREVRVGRDDRGGTTVSESREAPGEPS
jgi:hypothetical protein